MIMKNENMYILQNEIVTTFLKEKLSCEITLGRTKFSSCSSKCLMCFCVSLGEKMQNLIHLLKVVLAITLSCFLALKRILHSSAVKTFKDIAPKENLRRNEKEGLILLN